MHTKQNYPGKESMFNLQKYICRRKIINTTAEIYLQKKNNKYNNQPVLNQCRDRSSGTRKPFLFLMLKSAYS
jgi:hypothetical protein